MQIVIMLALAATLSAASYEKPPEPSWLLAAGAAAYLAGAAVVSRTAGLLVARIDARPPTRVRTAWRAALGAASSAWLVLGSVALVELGYGMWIYRMLDAIHAASWPLVGEIVLMAPFLLALLLTWTQEYPAYLRSRQMLSQCRPGTEEGTAAAVAAWTLREYVSYNVRHQLLFVAAPAGLILLSLDVLGLVVPAILGKGQTADWVMSGGSLVCAGLVFLIVPAIVVRLWRTGPLEAGPMRDELDAISRRMRLRFRRLVVWRTGGTIANAGVMGLIARLRYVMLSDVLLERMDRRHVQAVFAHEAGHIVSHHILYLAMFVVATGMLGGRCGDLLCHRSGLSPDAASAIVLGCLVVLWALALGYISRRFERQSDVIAAWVMGSGPCPDSPSPVDAGPGERGRIRPEGAAIFAGALERIAEINGIAFNRGNWRHGSIAWRVQYVLMLGATAGSRDDIDRLVRRIKALCWLLLAAGLAATAWQAL